jgi:hypothetical protein
MILFNPDPKPMTYKNEDYLKFIRTLGCFICDQKAEPHHIRRSYWGAGMGKKGSDYCTINLCTQCHSREHTNPFLQDMERIIIDNLINYIEKMRNKWKSKKKKQQVDI